MAYWKCQESWQQETEFSHLKGTVVSTHTHELGFTITTLLFAAADRIDANPHLAPTATVSAGFPAAILGMTARSMQAGLRETVAAAERTELANSLRASLYQRTAASIGAQRDSRHSAHQAVGRATQARRQLTAAETSTAQDIGDILDLIGDIPAGITRRQLASLFRDTATALT